MNKLENADFRDKVSIIRCDFNVETDDSGKVIDDSRIRRSIPTIRKVLDSGGRVLLIAHTSGEKTLRGLVSFIESLIKEKVVFIEKIDPLDEGRVFLLENLRKFNGEKENSLDFANKIASLGDIYINEAFSVCHRDHSSISKIPKIIDSYPGLNLMEEIRMLSKVKNDPWRPLVTIIGGAKVESKIKAIRVFMDMSDHLLIGGKVANEILTIKGISPNHPWPSQKIVDAVEGLELTSDKVHLPVDLVVSAPGYNQHLIVPPGRVRNDEIIYDIGPDTIKIYSEIIRRAGMIIWSGPLGLFEKDEYKNGTLGIARAISMNYKAFRIIGGGDTGIAITKFDFNKSIDHISTGGSAMLDFLANYKLPGLEALGYYED